MIKNILARQKEEINRFFNRKIIKRRYLDKWEQNLNNNLIKVITGIRRSGKSTLGLLLLRNKNFAYVNFDEKELYNINTDELLENLKEIYGDFNYILLDEIQNLENWELIVNSLQRLNYNVIITGSNSKLLSRELSTYLTGRYINIEVFPFDFYEFLLSNDVDVNNLNLLFKENVGLIKKYLKEYLYRGGFPEYILYNLNEDYLVTLFNSILYKDILYRYKIREVEKIDELSRYLINNFSNYYTISKIKNILNFNSKVTIEKYIKYLEEAYIIFSLHNYSLKYKETIRSPRKIYVIDNGLINALSNRIDLNIGKLMENLVFLELRKRYKENINLYYFKKNNEYEVDFLIKEGLDIKQLIQVSYVNSRDELDKREIRSLIKASNLLNCNNLLIISWDYEDNLKIDNKEIKVIPLYKWLLNF